MSEIKNNVYYCYRLDFVPKRIFWKPHSQCLWMWCHLEIRFCRCHQVKLRSYYIRVDSNFGWYLYKEKKETPDTQNEDVHVKTGVMIRIVFSQTKEDLEQPEAGRGKEGSMLRELQWALLYWYLDFRLLSSKTERK